MSTPHYNVFQQPRHSQYLCVRWSSCGCVWACMPGAHVHASWFHMLSLRSPRPGVMCLDEILHPHLAGSAVTTTQGGDMSFVNCHKQKQTSILCGSCLLPPWVLCSPLSPSFSLWLRALRCLMNPRPWASSQPLARPTAPHTTTPIGKPCCSQGLQLTTSS